VNGARRALAVALLALLASCASDPPPRVTLTEAWPTQAADYKSTTTAWTRDAKLHGDFQEILGLAAVFKSTEWRAAHAARDAMFRGLEGDARAQVLAQAQADAAGPYEVELLVTTWDRRENDLDKGKRSIWRVALLDDQDHEILPLEIVRDKRPFHTLRAEFPMLDDFAVAYVARFPRTQPVLGPSAKQVRLRMSSERGGVELAWAAP
jgi:hypothetical protein